MQRSISDRIGARVAAKLASDVGHRADFHLSDFRMAGSDLATIAVGFDAGIGRPNVQDVSDYITKAFEGNLAPHMSTLRLHADANALTVNVSQTRPCRDHKDIEQMIPNGPGRFIEASTRCVWEVEDNDGTPALYRVAEDDLNAILDHRMNSVSSRYASSTARIAKLIDSGRVMAVPGANVMFFSEGGKELVGCVMSEPDNHGYLSVTITGQESTTRVHENQIHEMLTTAALDANTKKVLNDYYTEAFGDAGYASQLTNETVVSGNKDELVAFLGRSGVMDARKALAFVDTLRITPNKVATAGPNDMILAQYNGIGYNWQIDMEKAEAVITKNA